VGWLAPRRNPRLAHEGPAAGDATLARDSELRALRLEVAERDELVTRLEADLRRQQEAEASRLDARSHSDLERFLAGIATPLRQLATQSQLDGVDAASVLAVVRALLRDLEDEGVAIDGRVGAVVPYDPTRHEPLGDAHHEAGDPVVVRLAGLGYHGTLLRRASVEATGSGA
jgi:hypothetical protein